MLMKILHVGNNCQQKRLWDVIIFWPQKSQIADIADNIPISFVPMSDLSQEEMLFEAKDIRELWEVRKLYTYFWDNDILLAKVTPCFENGKCGIAKNLENGIGFWSSEFFVLRTKDEILPEYLYYIISGKSFREEWAKNMWWAVGLQRVKKEWLLNFQIPLPPLEEQKKIVAYLDELNATISKLKSEYQSQLAMLDEMWNSSLDLAFWGSRERAYNLNNWKWVKLGEVCEILDSKRKPITQKDRIDWPYPYYWATWIVDYVNDYLFDEKLVLIWEDWAKWGSGDNTAFSVEGKIWVNNHAHVLRPFRKQLCDDFLIYYLLIKDLSEYITGTTVPKLNQEKLKNIEIPLPDLEMQSQIVSHLDQVHQQITMLKTQLKSQIGHCDELWQSSLEKVLTQGVNNEFN